MIQVPQAVIKKHEWCNSNYDKPVLLLERSNEITPIKKPPQKAVAEYKPAGI
jgi:hypothetical protein